MEVEHLIPAKESSNSKNTNPFWSVMLIVLIFLVVSGSAFYYGSRSKKDLSGETLSVTDESVITPTPPPIKTTKPAPRPTSTSTLSPSPKATPIKTFNPTPTFSPSPSPFIP